MKRILISLMLIVFGCAAFAGGKANHEKTVTVEINFGTEKAAETVTVLWEKELSALEALQKAAVVVTHPVGNYIFVTSIDDVAATRGEMAWYYRINNQEPGKLAMNLKVKPGDTLSWRYVKDVCSCTVDGVKEQ